MIEVKLHLFQPETVRQFCPLLVVESLLLIPRILSTPLKQAGSWFWWEPHLEPPAKFDW